MSQREQWFGKFEAEIGQELGQPVTLAAGGEPPAGARSWTDTIQIPGARLTLAADREDVTAFLIEARVIEARQADSEMVRELWSGILASIASRMGGKASPSSAQAPSAEPCGLRLGNAQVRLSLSVEAAAEEAGYSSSAAFVRAFQREFGETPARWRRSRDGTCSSRSGPGGPMRRSPCSSR